MEVFHSDAEKKSKTRGLFFCCCLTSADPGSFSCTFIEVMWCLCNNGTSELDYLRDLDNNFLTASLK